MGRPKLKPEFNVMDGIQYRKCMNCDAFKQHEEFRPKDWERTTNSRCADCMKEYEKQQRIDKKRKADPDYEPKRVITRDTPVKIEVNEEGDKILQCGNCRAWKFLDDFYKDSTKTNSNSEGHCTKCKQCEQDRGKVRYENNSKDMKEKAKKVWHGPNHEHNLEVKRATRLKNLEKYRQASRMWHQLNKEWDNNYRRERYKSNPQFKIAVLCRSRIKEALKHQSAVKSNHSIDLLGCTWEEHKEFLESKFEEGMTWENIGVYKADMEPKTVWQIDHITPISSFDLTNPDEQNRAFHYTNTQPMWAEENLSKGGSF